MELELFEKAIVLRTICAGIDLNFCGVDDLQDVDIAAQEMGIELPEYDFDNYYNSDYEDLVDIQQSYMETINKICEDLRKDILNLIN